MCLFCPGCMFVVEAIVKKWQEQNVGGKEQEIEEVVAVLSGTGELLTFLASMFMSFI